MLYDIKQPKEINVSFSGKTLTFNNSLSQKLDDDVW